MNQNQFVLNQPPQPQQEQATPEPQIQQQNNGGLDELQQDLFQEAKGIEEFSEPLESLDNIQEGQPDIAFAPELQTTQQDSQETKNIAIENTRIAMDARENLQAYGLAYYVDGSIKNFNQFLYEPVQKENLVRAWSRVFQEHNIRVPKYLDILQAELFATGPLLALAASARKYRKEAEQQRNRAERAEKNRSEPYNRPNQKTPWIVDDKGYFEYGLKNGKWQRFRKAEKKVRPVPEGEALDRLINANGADKINRIYMLE